MALGFFVVLLVLGPGEDTTLPDPFADSAGAKIGPDKEPPVAPVVDAAHEGPDPGSTGAVAVEAVEVESGSSPQPQPTVDTPLPQVAGTISLNVGDPFIWRCWAEGSDAQLEKDACGSLAGVESIIDDRLGVIEKCVVDHAGKGASGKLSLALRVDFSDGSVKAWLGNSTTVEKMAEVSACLRTGFAEASVPSIGHDHARYIVFFNVDVG
jgi:hypothetical protein